MPGYRFGVKDALVLRRIGPPEKTSLQDVDRQSLTWFEEQREALAPIASDDDALPPARFAVDLRGGNEIVVYGEQCLSAKLCFTWQCWPPAAQTAK